MDRTEAGNLIQSIDKKTLATAKALITSLLPAMKGGKWDTMPASKKIVLLVAIALKYGERRGNHDKGKTAAEADTV